MEDLCDDDMMSTCELNRLEPISNRITNIFFSSSSFMYSNNLFVCLLLYVIVTGYNRIHTNDSSLITQLESK